MSQTGADGQGIELSGTQNNSDVIVDKEAISQRIEFSEPQNDLLVKEDNGKEPEIIKLELSDPWNGANVKDEMSKEVLASHKEEEGLFEDIQEDEEMPLESIEVSPLKQGRGRPRKYESFVGMEGDKDGPYSKESVPSVKRKRGRPRKHRPLEEEESKVGSESLDKTLESSQSDINNFPLKRKRGRPRKDGSSGPRKEGKKLKKKVGRPRLVPLGEVFHPICPKCGVQFRSNGLLNRHYRIKHLNHKPYKCQFCDRVFTQSANKKRHERTHTGERPYKCRFCERAFAHLNRKKSHERTHLQ